MMPIWPREHFQSEIDPNTGEHILSALFFEYLLGIAFHLSELCKPTRVPSLRVRKTDRPIL